MRQSLQKRNHSFLQKVQHFPEECFLIELPVVIIKTSNLTLPVGSCETNLIGKKKAKTKERLPETL